MSPSTVLVSALLLPGADYSSAHLLRPPPGGNENGTSAIPPRRQLSQPSATHAHASPSEGEEKKCVKKNGGTKGRMEIGQIKENEKRPF